MWTSGTTWYAEHDGEVFAISVGEAAAAQATATSAGIDPEAFKPLLAGGGHAAAVASPGVLLCRRPDEGWVPYDPSAPRRSEPVAVPTDGERAPADTPTPASTSGGATPAADPEVTATES